MKLIEIINEDDFREIPTPLPYDEGRKDATWSYADKVEDLMLDAYKKAHNITSFSSDPRLYIKALNEIRYEYGNYTDVPMDKIVGTEPNLYQAHLDALTNKSATKISSDTPIFYKVKDSYYIADGNHRVAVAFNRGDKMVKGLVLDLPEIEKRLR